METRDLVVRIKGETNDFEKSMSNVGGKSEQTGLSFGKLTGAIVAGQAIFAGLSTVLSGVENALGRVEDFAKSSFEAAVDLDSATLKLQKNFGVTAEQGSSLVGVFGRFGISVDQISKAFVIFQKNLENVNEGEAIGVKAITTLGVATTDGAGHLRNMYDVLGDVADKFKSGVVPSTMAASVAAKIFGKSGADLIPVLLKGKDGIAELTKELKANNLVLDQGTINTYKEFAKRQADLDEKVKGFKTTLGNALMPMVSNVIDHINKWIEANGGVEKIMREKVIPKIEELKAKIEDFAKKASAWWKEHGDTVIQVSKQIGTVVWDIMTVLVTLESINNRVGGSIVGVFKWIYDAIADVIGMFNTLYSTVISVMSAIGNAIRAPFDAAVNAVRGDINDINNAIKGIAGAPANVAKDFFDPAHLLHRAGGGPVNAGQPYIVGEKGQELFVPNQSGTIVPNNQLSSAGGGPSITVNVGMYAGMPVEKRQIALELYKELVRAARAQGVSMPMIGAMSPQ